MADTIFINYRREDPAATAGRLHDRLAQVFGRKRIFMDVDQIPAGIDFVAHLNSQVAACNVVLVIIGPDWLHVKNEAGQSRLNQSDDFVAIEIAAALARNIRVIPVLVDGASIPKTSELPDSLKPLVRRQAIEVRQPHFGRDAEALIERIREAIGQEAGLGRWRGRALAGAAAPAVLLLIGAGGYVFLGHLVERGAHLAELKLEEERKAADAETNRKVMDAAIKAEQDRQAKAAQDRVDAQNAYNSGTGSLEKGDYDRAIADYNESIRLNPNNYLTFGHRGFAYLRKGDNDRAIADINEAIRLNPNNSVAFSNRALAYPRKGDYRRAIADYNEVIRLNPTNALAFCRRGFAKSKINDRSANADIANARQLDPWVYR